MTKINETVEFIESKGKFGMKLGLENISRLLKKLGDPQEKLKFIHVAGSNGKGSICTMLESVLTEADIKTGIYTSPHLENFSERIRINKERIGQDDINRLFKIIKEKCEELVEETGEYPTGFEIETAMALLYFLENDCDLVVLEVGLGGRLDATNVIPSPLVSIISHISLEHTKWLGNTLGEVAFEKGGIIKSGTNLVIAPQENEAKETLLKLAKERKVSTVRSVDNKAEKINEDINFLNLKYNDEIYSSSLHGNYQLDNIPTVLEVLDILKDHFDINKENIDNGLKKVRFPGRFEIISYEPMIILDGAHNVDGIENFVESFKALFNSRTATTFFGMIKEKDVDECIRELLKITDAFYLLEPDSPDAIPLKELEDRIKNIDPDIKVIKLEDYKKINKIIEEGNLEDIYIFTGSLYMIGEARKTLRSNKYWRES